MILIKVPKYKNPSEIHICKENLRVSVLTGQGESLSSETPDTLRISLKNKRKKTPDTSVIRKQHIQEPLNPSKRSK